MNRGGKRTGAGRKQGFSAKSAEEARRELAGMLIGEIRAIGEALIAKAKKGDVSATRELFDRAWGRPIQVSETIMRDENRWQAPIDYSTLSNEELYEIIAQTKNDIAITKQKISADLASQATSNAPIATTERV